MIALFEDRTQVNRSFIELAQDYWRAAKTIRQARAKRKPAPQAEVNQLYTIYAVAPDEISNRAEEILRELNNERIAKITRAGKTEDTSPDDREPSA